MTDKFYLFMFCFGLFGFGVSLTILGSGLRVRVPKRRVLVGYRPFRILFKIMDE